MFLRSPPFCTLLGFLDQSHTSLGKFAVVTFSSISSYVSPFRLSVLDALNLVFYVSHLLLFPHLPQGALSLSPAIFHLHLNPLHRFLCCICGFGFSLVELPWFFFYISIFLFRFPVYSHIASTLSLRPSGVFII